VKIENSADLAAQRTRACAASIAAEPPGPYRVGAENAVTAADLVYWMSEFAELLREHRSFEHCQYL
jgi:hypothetical protein